MVLLLFAGVFAWKQLDRVPSGAEGDERRVKNVSEEHKFWAHMNAGDQFRLNGDYRKAEESYSKALEIKENHPGVLYHLGIVQLFLKDFRNAEKNWQQIITQDSIVARAWLQLGKIYFCKDSDNPFYDPVEAVGFFKKAASLNRENTGPQLYLAKIAILNEEYAAAEVYLDGIVAQHFKSYEGMFLIGFVNWKRGRPASTERPLSEAIEIYKKSNQMKMDGEGATKSGSNPMLVEETFCDRLGREIERLMNEVEQADQEEIFVRFERFIENWREV